jgi:hypothetical protein
MKPLLAALALLIGVAAAPESVEHPPTPPIPGAGWTVTLHDAVDSSALQLACKRVGPKTCCAWTWTGCSTNARRHARRKKKSPVAAKLSAARGAAETTCPTWTAWPGPKPAWTCSRTIQGRDDVRVPIIMLSGQAGSGKDTVAHFLVKNHGAVSIAQADPMKRLAMKLFGFSEETLWGPSERRNDEPQRLLLPELDTPRYARSWVDEVLPAVDRRAGRRGRGAAGWTGCTSVG